MTLEEIKAIVYPKDKVDMIEVVKELLKLKNFKEGELVTFNGIYMYDIGDPGLYLTGLSIIKGNLICTADVIYGGDVCDFYIGTVTNEDRTGRIPDDDKGIFLTNEAIKKACQKILDEKTNVDFDFKEMKAVDSWYFNGYYFEKYIEKHESAKEKIESYCNGTSVGCICY